MSVMVYCAGGSGDRRFGPPSTDLPYSGFHAFLAKGLTGYAVRHPLRPLPMMRW